MSDSHFLGTKFGLHAEGIFAQSQEYFGEHYLHPSKDVTLSGAYEIARYRRAGLKIGTGYNLKADYYFWIDWRFENILAEEPKLVEDNNVILQNSAKPEVGYLEPDSSLLSGLTLGINRDTTNHPVMPFKGSLTKISVELSNPVLGSSYDFAKFIVNHKTYFPFGKKGQSISVGGIGGIITGDAPFFEQFFVGDFSSLSPDRKLGLNFTNLHPKVLNTSIGDMWYEDLVLSLNVEYSFPFYRGSATVYGINGFIHFGAYSLTSTSKIDDRGVPIDITGDLGIRIDTAVGVFTISFANILQLIPPVRKETTQ
jgi:outer membrane protein assembly factor BamA